MKIVELQQSGGLLVSLNPDDCYTLAEACRRAADDFSEDSKADTAPAARAAHLYDIFCALLEGYAIAGAAYGFMAPPTSEGFSVQAVRRTWDRHDGRSS